MGNILSRLWHRAGRNGLPAQDRRRRRIVAVIECILNQNARDAGAASTPALNAAVLGLCAEFDVGIVQIPCPEIEYLGVRRDRPPGVSIRQALDTPGGRRSCAEISARVADRLREYSRQGNCVMAILGGNDLSPGCAVSSDQGGTATCSGVLVQELQRALQERQMDIPFRGIRDADPALQQADLDWLRARLSRADG